MDRVVTCPCAICATRFVRLRLGDDNNSLRNRMVADAAASSFVDNISRRNNDGKTSTGPFPRRHHPFDDVTFSTFTPGQLMPQHPPRTQVVRPSPLCYPIELGRGEANPGSMDSSSSMPRGSFDPGPRDYFMCCRMYLAWCWSNSKHSVCNLHSPRWRDIFPRWRGTSRWRGPFSRWRGECKLQMSQV